MKLRGSLGLSLVEDDSGESPGVWYLRLYGDTFQPLRAARLHALAILLARWEAREARRARGKDK